MPTVAGCLVLSLVIIIMAICIAPVCYMALMAHLHIKHHVKTILLMPIKRLFCTKKKIYIIIYVTGSVTHLPVCSVFNGKSPVYIYYIYIYIYIYIYNYH